MAIQTTTEKNSLASKYAADGLYGAVYTTAAGATAGTEPTGGTPAYARLPLSWGAPVNGVATATATFNIPAGTTIVSGGLHTAATGGNYLDGGAITSQTFASQGTFAVTFTYTQS